MVVAIMMDNRPDYLFCVLGLNRIGAVASLLNTNLSGHALDHALKACGASHLFLGTEHALAFAESQSAKSKKIITWLHADSEKDESDTTVNRDILSSSARNMKRSYTPSGNDIYCYIYTSGTTGLPKAAVIRNQRMLGANVFFGHLVHQCSAKSLIYVPLPLYHSNAMLLGFGSALATGAAIGLRRKFSTSGFWPDVRTFKATSFVYIGELCRYLLNAPYVPAEQYHHLEVAVGNGLRPDIWQAFQDRFGIPIIREFYGSTEGNAPAINFSGKPGMIGKLGPSMVVVCCDPSTGEIVRNEQGWAQPVEEGKSGLLLGKISKLMTFEGYVDKKATQKKLEENLFKKGDRYFNTGDLVTLNPAKWLSFKDRLGDTYRWKGENVSTTEVAQVLNGADGVLESNVYGVTVPQRDGRAGMVALSAAPEFDLKSFGDFVNHNLATFQRPLFVRMLQNGMRVTGTFKHQKSDYQTEGFDPSKIEDPLFVLHQGAYVPIDSAKFDAIASGSQVI